MDHGVVHDALRLGKGELDHLIARLNRASAGAGDAKRRNKRWIMQSQRGLLTVQDQHGGVIHFAVVLRNMSRTGVALLHGGFMHKGGRCRVAIRRVDGGSNILPATVVRCRHIEGRVHDIGLVLDAEAEPRDYFLQVNDEYLFHAESVDPGSLRGRVLLVEDSTLDVRLFQKAFDGTAVEVVVAGTAGGAVEMMSQEPGMAFIDYGLPDCDGIELVGRIRGAGHATPIVLVSANIDQELRITAISAGASEMIFKPFKTELLQRAAAEFLRPSDGACGVDAGMVIELPKDLSVTTAREVLAEFRRLGRQLNAAIGADDYPTALSVATEIRNSADGFGFAPILGAADEAHRVLTRAKKIAPAMAEARRLVRVCEAVRLSADAARASIDGGAQQAA